jgi:hypothetical protein
MYATEEIQYHDDVSRVFLSSNLLVSEQDYDRLSEILPPPPLLTRPQSLILSSSS